MIAIYSHWSVPCNLNGNKIHGKLDKDYFMAYLSTSVRYAKLFFDKVILFTDTEGLQFFSDNTTPILSPAVFDKVEVILDNINFPPNFWAIGKIYAFQYAAVVYQQPFIHFDYDSFITDNVVHILENQPLIAQHKETEDFYADYSKYGLKPNKYAYNTGIFGGSDVRTIADYCAGALETAEKLREFTHPVKDRLISCIFEQKYLYDFCNERKIKPFLASENIREVYRHYWHNKQDPGAMKEALSHLSRSYNIGT